LVNTDASTEGDLQNNGALADAAAAGLPYYGTAQVYNIGYAGSNSTASVESTANRQVGFANVTANSVSTALGASQPETSIYVGNTPRSAVGDGNGNFWTAGTGSGTITNGFQYFNTPTQLAPAPTNTRSIQIRGNQLYGASDTGSTYVGISVIGSGTPTTAGTATALFNSGGTLTSTSSTASPYSFVLFDDPNNLSTPSLAPYNVAYIADLGVNGFGGIQKWTYNPANAAVDNGWSESYVISDGTNVGTDGYLGVAGQLVTNANPALDQVVLYATNADGTVLEQFTDPLEATNNTAVDASVITLATAGTDQIFRGVALAPVPEPTSLSLVGLGALGLLRRRRNRA
jgi:hypothetical protein